MRITSTVTDIYGNEHTNLTVKICTFSFNHTVITIYNPDLTETELEQLSSGYRQKATFEIGFFIDDNDFLLKRCRSSNSIKLPNVLLKFSEDMSIEDLDTQDASVYFDNIVKEHLINSGISEENIAMS